jgi:hypothetical protein
MLYEQEAGMQTLRIGSWTRILLPSSFTGFILKGIRLPPEDLYIKPEIY